MVYFFGFKSHIFISSQLPEAKYLPSGEKDTDSIEYLCPSKVFINFPVPTSHSFIVLSLLPEAKYLPSGEKDTELTEPKFKIKVKYNSGLILVCALIEDFNKIVIKK
ncbi:MAG: hypothetical protein KatS3mg129_0413 [Leptospiraceae bacterium]|nr:MAG: hypothetical protein KatS3mg129_0413 [Leptospiraceae bacterium]